MKTEIKILNATGIAIEHVEGGSDVCWTNLIVSDKEGDVLEVCVFDSPPMAIDHVNQAPVEKEDIHQLQARQVMLERDAFQAANDSKQQVIDNMEEAILLLESELAQVRLDHVKAVKLSRERYDRAIAAEQACEELRAGGVA